jgi:uncharacterized membrane protein
VLAVFLALGSAVAWGVADFLGGMNTRRYALLGVIAVSQVAGFVVVGAVVVATTTGPPEARYVLFAVLAGLAGAVGITALYRGLAVGAMSIVAPITATGAMIPVGVGISAGERARAASRRRRSARRCRAHYGRVAAAFFFVRAFFLMNVSTACCASSSTICLGGDFIR